VGEKHFIYGGPASSCSHLPGFAHEKTTSPAIQERRRMELFSDAPPVHFILIQTSMDRPR